jgi:hypothetical protein
LKEKLNNLEKDTKRFAEDECNRIQSRMKDL